MQKKKFPKQDEIDFDNMNPDAAEEARNAFPVIFSYSRAEALADGTLRDVGEIAVATGFKCPVAFTRAAWEKVVTVPDFELCESEEGRLWDVLSVLRFVAQGREIEELEFSMYVPTPFDSSERVRLRAVCGPGDDGNPVITVMLRHES